MKFHNQDKNPLGGSICGDLSEIRDEQLPKSTWIQAKPAEISSPDDSGHRKRPAHPKTWAIRFKIHRKMHWISETSNSDEGSENNKIRREKKQQISSFPPSGILRLKTLLKSKLTKKKKKKRIGELEWIEQEKQLKNRFSEEWTTNR